MCSCAQSAAHPTVHIRAQTSRRTGNSARKNMFQNEYGTAVKRKIISLNTSRKWIPKFGVFGVLPREQLIFIGKLLWTLESSTFSIRRCFSQRQWSSSVRWH